MPTRRLYSEYLGSVFSRSAENSIARKAYTKDEFGNVEAFIGHRYSWRRRITLEELYLVDPRQ
ncbi:hypothetical protein D918_07455, partial [Trichuris suis]